jgi:hypothetical protein
LAYIAHGHYTHVLPPGNPNLVTERNQKSGPISSCKWK